MSSLLSKLKYGFGRAAVVPAGGTLQLFAPGQSLEGFRVIRGGLITGLSLRTNVVDAARAFSLQARVNGVVTAAALAYPVATLSAQTILLAVPVAVGDIITMFLVRAAGAGASTFASEQAQVEITEQ